MHKITRCVALLLSLILLAASALPVSAADTNVSTDAALVVVSGFGTVPLFLHAGSSDAVQMMPPSGTALAKDIASLVPPSVKLMFSNDWQAWSHTVDSILNSVIEPLLCDEDGNSILDVDVRHYPLSVDHYPDLLSSDYRDEAAFAHAGADAFGGENVYFFSYDWRQDPLDHADTLRTYIQRVLRETHKKKVVLAACSMGGAITMAYLYKYGTDVVKTVILDNSAFQGIKLIGETFCLDVSVDKDSMVDYLLQFRAISKITNGGINRFVMRLHTTDAVMNVVQALFDNTLDNVAEDVLYPVFGQMPGIWAFVADADYTRAKACVLDAQKNRELIRRIDEYHYNVQCKAKKILQRAMRRGCIVAVLANYGKRGIPLNASKDWANDYLIETTLASGGAICADYGKTLPEGYRQKVRCGHNHLSPDRCIDASTCMFPEYTWFVRDMGHLDFPYDTDGAAFLMWLVSRDRQPTVRTDPRYPQFMVYDADTGKLSPQS